MRRLLILALLCGAFLGMLSNLFIGPAPQPVRVVPGGHVYYPTVVPFVKDGQHSTINAHPTPRP